MGLRVDTDVQWKEMSVEFQLSEDGFCNKCKDFNTDCFCEAFWIRRSASFKKQLSSTLKAKTKLKELLDKIENASVCAAISPSSEVLQNILHILFKGNHHDYKLD